jgi:hypothetical protein
VARDRNAAGGRGRPTRKRAKVRPSDGTGAARIILGVSGSIAAYKAADLASRLKKRGHHVTAILTKNACELISPNTFLNLTGNRVFTELFDKENGQTEHIKLTDEAELVVVAPATANTIAKMALGLADDMLSTTLLAVKCPVLVCPAMNTRMWDHSTVRRNLGALRAQGVRILEPDAGALACGHVGPGRLVEPEAIVEAVEAFLREARASEPRRESLRLYVERQAFDRSASGPELASELRYRTELARDGHLVASGTLGSPGGGAVHVHRARSLEEARGRAERSPLSRAGATTFELAEWRLDAGEVGGLIASAGVFDPEAPTARLARP